MTIDNCKVIYRSTRTSGIKVAENSSQRNLYMDGNTLQSSMQLTNPNGLYLEYSQAMMCALLFQPAPKKVLLVGLGGGSLVKFLLDFCPETKIDVAEINSEVIQIAQDFFLLPENERLQIMTDPGEVIVAEKLLAGDSYDLILLDAFDENGPARPLLEEQFLMNCRALLTEGGVFTMNLWNRPVDNFPAILTTLSTLFTSHVLKLILPAASQNGIVFGFNEPLPVTNMMELKSASRELSRQTGINFMRWLRQIHWQNIQCAS